MREKGTVCFPSSRVLPSFPRKMGEQRMEDDDAEDGKGGGKGKKRQTKTRHVPFLSLLPSHSHPPPFVSNTAKGRGPRRGTGA